MKAAVHTAIKNRESVQFTAKIVQTKTFTKDRYLLISSFVEETIGALKANTFKPEKYTDAKGSRRFSIAPVHSYQCCYVQLDKYTLPPILARAGITCPSQASDDVLLDILWKYFDF
jgi:hypothetical protein